MGSMQVKAQGLLNAAKYIEDNFGPHELGAVLRAGSPAMRDTCLSGIAINWHPVDELCEFVDIAESQLGDGTGKLAQEIGASGAAANLKGILLRAAFHIGNPSFFMKRIAGMWRQFNDEGSMDLLEMSSNSATVEVRGLAKPRATFCRVLTGWVTAVSRALGAQQITVTHTECRARGQARCIWEVRGRVIPG